MIGQGLILRKKLTGQRLFLSEMKSGARHFFVPQMMGSRYFSLKFGGAKTFSSELIQKSETKILKFVPRQQVLQSFTSYLTKLIFW